MSLAKPVAGGAGGAHFERSRVLFLVGQLGFGGSEGQLRLLVKSIDKAAWELQVLVFHPSPNADYVAELRGAEVGITTMPSAANGPLSKLVFTTRVARRFRPDVIHSWTVHDNPYAAWAGWLSGARVRWGSVRSSTSLPGFRSLPAWYRRIALRSVQRLVVNSQALVNELHNLGIDWKRLMVLSNCVGPATPCTGPAQSRFFEELGFSAGHPVFGCVGNIRRVKNQALFVRALARVIANDPEARGVIVGDTLEGEEGTRAELEAEIEGLGLGGRVILAGFRPDVPILMSGMAAMCMTSDSEGMPNVVLEAMAAGAPVIATAVGGVPDVVRHGETGQLVEAGDEVALAEAMIRVLEQPDETRRMAAAAREFVQEHRGCAVMARRLEAAYSAALAEAGGS